MKRKKTRCSIGQKCMADLATVIARAASFFVPLPHGPTLPTKQHNIIITVAFLGLGWGVGEGGGVGRGGEGKGGVALQMLPSSLLVFEGIVKGWGVGGQVSRNV